MEPPASATVLRRGLRAAGFGEVTGVQPAAGGNNALAAVVTLLDAPPVFAKTLPETSRARQDLAPVEPDVFQVEAEGLRALRELGGVRTPEVLSVQTDLLVLEPLAARREDPGAWEALAVAVAALHTRTAGQRFGWHRDGWLGRLRQVNSWSLDGHAFYAEHRILRYLAEPGVRAALDPADRLAVERLCQRLGDVLPVAPACLTHGDLWSGNVLSAVDGTPALVDPAVSYCWAETDIAMLWCTQPRAVHPRSFAVYAEHAGLEPGWQQRAPVLLLRELLSTIAHGVSTERATTELRATTAPFRRRSPRLP